MSFGAILLAVLPVLAFLIYILLADMRSPEPIKMLFKALLLGFLTIPLSMLFSSFFTLIGLSPEEIETVGDAINTSYWGAAIPEEVAKFLMFWLLVRKNRHFDEKMDGILYAVIISLGFAVLENLLYLYSAADDFLEVGIMRAIFSIPGHFGFGVLMGYFYSLAVFGNSSKKKLYLSLSLILPILVHGIYDSLLFMQEVEESYHSAGLTTFCNTVFVLFCILLWWCARGGIRIFSKEQPVVTDQPRDIRWEDESYYIRMDDMIFGPYTLSEIKEYPLLRDTMVTTDPNNGWYEAELFECFDELFQTSEHSNGAKIEV